MPRDRPTNTSAGAGRHLERPEQGERFGVRSRVVGAPRRACAAAWALTAGRASCARLHARDARRTGADGGALDRARPARHTGGRAGVGHRRSRRARRRVARASPGFLADARIARRIHRRRWSRATAPRRGARPCLCAPAALAGRRLSGLRARARIGFVSSDDTRCAVSTVRGSHAWKTSRSMRATPPGTRRRRSRSTADWHYSSHRGSSVPPPKCSCGPARSRWSASSRSRGCIAACTTHSTSQVVSSSASSRSV